ncbi:MAG: glycosyltransferase family 2 protein, partial [bacterium]|nr:glycosyltransferase family 2 protein [bacterium]
MVEALELPLAEAVEMCLEIADTTGTAGFFHAGWAKNTSHQAALALGPPTGCTSDILVNLDADNIIGELFLEKVARHFTDEAVGCVAFRGAEGATTGRVAVRPAVFEKLGGYDQEPGIHGSGGQDVDLCHRAKICTKVVQVSGGSGTEQCHRTVGYPVLNIRPGEPKKHERTYAKISKVFNPRNLKWGNMNTENWNAMSEKRKRAGALAYKRNVGLEVGGWRVAHVNRNQLAGLVGMASRDLATHFSTGTSSLDIVEGLPPPPPAGPPPGASSSSSGGGVGGLPPPPPETQTAPASSSGGVGGLPPLPLKAKTAPASSGGGVGGLPPPPPQATTAAPKTKPPPPPADPPVPPPDRPPPPVPPRRVYVFSFGLRLVERWLSTRPAAVE